MAWNARCFASYARSDIRDELTACRFARPSDLVPRFAKSVPTFVLTHNVRLAIYTPAFHVIY
jgi:hypothetical protein